MPANPDTNYGSATSVTARSGGALGAALFKFNMSLPPEAVVESATLELYLRPATARLPPACRCTV